MPSIAPLVAAIQRRLVNPPVPVGSSGETFAGAAVQVEMLAAGSWVDVTATSSVMVRDDSGQVSVTRGIRDEGNATEQANATMQLKNTDGRFSPRNPSGIYYGQIGRNTPFRISVPDGMGGKNYRAWVEASQWAPSWDVSGNDVWTDLTADGILRRLAQGPPAERSVIYNAITSPVSSSLMAYWPMEDASGATALASALTSGSPMTWTGTPDLASFEQFTASDPLPDITTSTLSGGVPKYTDPTATQVRFLAFIPKSGLTDGKVLCAFDQIDYSAGSAQFFELYYSTTTATNSLVLRTCASDGTVLGAELPHTLDVRGRLLYVSVELQESGTGITRQIQLRDVTNSRTFTVSDTEALTQLTRVSKVQFGPASRAVSGPAGSALLPGVTVGHCTVETAITAIDALGVRLNTIGESAGRRIQRLCGEQGIAFDSIGDLDDTTPLGAQGKGNPLSLMQEAALADGGMLYESTATLGLGYRTRASLYGQDPSLVLNYAAANLAQVPTPVEDDRYIQNKVTVTCNNVSGTYEETTGSLGTNPPPSGVGVYGSDLTLNLATSDTAALRDQAAWRVHLGTVNEARYPRISVNLAHSSITADMRRAILALRVGDRVQIINPPSWLPPDAIDQLVLGFDETITRFEHRITLNCQPASPYTVGVLDSAGTRIDTDGSQILTAVSSSATSMTVAPTTTPPILWTTDTAEVPFDVRASGEVMRVTAVTPWLSDPFGRTASSSWGTADTGQDWSTAGGSSTDFSVVGGAGIHTLTSVNVARRTFVDNLSVIDWDLYCDVAVSAIATGGSIWGGPTGRYIDSDNLYWARLEFDTSSVLTLQLRKRVNTVEGVLGTYVVPGTYAANTFYRTRLRVTGAVLQAKVWAATDVETPEWQITASDGTFSTTNFHGTRSISSSANTNVNPQVQYDNYQIVSPQTFVVTRSINGVVKAQNAGADVRLANPAYLAL